MTLESSSYREAHKKVAGILGNRFELLDNYDNNFPQLQSKNTNNTHQNHDSTAYIHKILPFSKVIKNNTNNTNNNRHREQAKARNTMQEWREAIKPVKSNEVIIETRKLQETQDTVNELSAAITKHLTTNIQQRLNPVTIELFNNIRTSLNKLINIFDTTLISNSSNDITN
uniref:Uncharacterized protein n=1 Tax=Bactrocera dorsalis TaxID=27457 RepID=A0A034WC41_BACDO